VQGKFQLVLVPAAGHSIHEDEPEATAAALAAFVRRCSPLRATASVQ
jgi:protein phosphatase methylesterase 1